MDGVCCGIRTITSARPPAGATAGAGKRWDGFMSLRLNAIGLLARPHAFAAVLAFMAATLAFVPAATAAGIFVNMDGAWRGSGSIKYSDGSSEGLSCTADNEVTDDGNKIKQVLKCAFPSGGSPLKITSNLTYKAAAGVVTGHWAEASYGVNGTVRGNARSGRIDASVNTSTKNLAVDVSVVTSGSQQTVTLRLKTPDVTEVFVNLRKT